MLVSKSYLRMEIKVLQSKNEDLEMMVRMQREELNKLRADKHTCDGYCEGCEHLIKTERIGTHPVYGIREWITTEKLCALDRKCKDYKAKKES